MRRLFKNKMVKMALYVVVGAIFSGAIMGVLYKIPGIDGLLSKIPGQSAPDPDLNVDGE